MPSFQVWKNLQKVALESQGHWCLRLHDGLAGLSQVDVEDSLLADFLGVRLRAQRGDEPRLGVSLAMIRLKARLGRSFGLDLPELTR